MTSVPRETWMRIEQARSLILAEAERQNLIARSTVPDFDQRHIHDSLQLAAHLRQGVLVDVGSGAGFPGLILACTVPDVVHLVEPRARRAAFLRDAVNELGLHQVTVHACRVEKLRLPAVATVTARAVAPLTDLFAMSLHLADDRTRWVLPKGRNAASELEDARRLWQGIFRLVPSETDAEASIIIAEGVRRRRKP